MAQTYDAIASQTLTSDQSSVTFSSINQNYTDLILVSSVRINQSGSSGLYCQPNGVTTANKGFTYLFGNGTAASSGRSSNDSYIRIGFASGTSTSSGTFSTSISNFMNYSNTTTYKTILSRGSETNIGVEAVVALFPSTNAITSLSIYANGLVNILTGSTFTLYGVKSA